MTMVISGSDGVTFPDSTNQFSGGAFSFKNRIINGDMRIAQRGTAAVTGNGDYPVDRFNVGNSTDGAYSAQQDSSAPAGFTSSVKITATTADGTLTGAQVLNIGQRIEGTNIADLGFGTANAKTVTLSFWVRSSLTGTFGGALRNSASDRSYPFTYAISVADTWEQKSVTIAGDTSGTWLTTTGIGIGVFFGLGAGPDRSGTAGAWNSNNNLSATGAVSVIGTLNATWYVTGVQLEVGSVATPFERRPFGAELALCQRYCINYRSADAGSITYTFGTGETPTSTLVQLTMPLPVEMRVIPSLTTTGTASNYAIYSANSNTACSAVPSINNTSNKLTAHMNWAVASGLTPGRAAQCIANSNNTAYLLFTAEL
jgi:hypothetical protein